MFGSVRHVFASRWKALWWAAGIMLTAYCSVPSPEPEPGSPEAKAALSAKHVNPWGKDYHPGSAKPSDTSDFNAMMTQLKEEERRQKDGPHENPWAKKSDAPKS
jgi:hypothetical protein